MEVLTLITATSSFSKIEKNEKNLREVASSQSSVHRDFPVFLGVLHRVLAKAIDMNRNQARLYSLHS